MLSEQDYTYLPIHNEEDLIRNLRTELGRLNQYEFTDAEWERFFKEALANPNDQIVEKAEDPGGQCSGP